MAYRIVKRALDIIFSALAILVFWPFLLLVALLIKIDSKGPAVYKQERVGRNEKIFFCYKFRTMRTDAPVCSTNQMDADRYITRAGRIIRRLSIDETMQFFNILRGDMSFIGPRPVIPAEYELNDLRMKNGAYSIRPGISGWAQVNGRDVISVRKKAEFDGYYASHLSFGLDFKIFWLTLLTVFTGRGYHEGAKPPKEAPEKMHTPPGPVREEPTDQDGIQQLKEE